MDNTNQQSATEFAKTHAVDTDWVTAVGIGLVTAWKTGDRVIYSGFEGVVVRHYHNGMFEVRLPGGVSCVGEYELQAA